MRTWNRTWWRWTGALLLSLGVGACSGGGGGEDPLVVGADGSASPSLDGGDEEPAPDVLEPDVVEPDTGAGGEGDAVVIAPDAPDEVAFQEALALYDAGQYAEARDAFEQLLADHPDSLRADNARYLIARCWFELGDFATAEDLFDTFLLEDAASPLATEAHYFLGRSRYEQALFQQASETFDGFLAAWPDSVFVDNASYYAGRCRYELADWAGALDRFDQVISDAASSYRDAALLYAGRAEYGWGKDDLVQPSPRFDDADAYLDTLLADYPGSVYEDNARYYHAMTRYQAEDYALAVQRFDALLAAFPASVYVDNGRYFKARCVYKQGLWAEAVGLFEALVADAPASVYVDNALYYAGRSHYEAGRDTGVPAEFEAAVDRFDQVVAGHPQSVYADNALYYAARSYLELGDCIGAQDAASTLQATWPMSTYTPKAADAVQQNGC